MFLDKILHGIGHFFSNLLGKVKPFMKKEIPVAITVLNAIKNGIIAVEGSPLKPVLDALVGKVPAELLEKAPNAINKVIIDLGLAKGVVDQSDYKAVILSAFNAINQAFPTEKSFMLKNLSALLVQYLSDDKITADEAWLFIQEAYKEGINIHLFGNVGEPAVQTPQVPTGSAPEQAA